MLVITIFNFIFFGIGMWATIKLHYYGIMAHAIYSISVVGGFYIFIIIDSIIVDSKEIEAAD